MYYTLDVSNSGLPALMACTEKERERFASVYTAKRAAYGSARYWSRKLGAAVTVCTNFVAAN